MFDTYIRVPSLLGGGKTTLLNALAGYTSISQGSIQVRGKKINKRIRRRISYVLQSDIFFANLTLRETLIVSVLPSSHARPPPPTHIHAHTYTCTCTPTHTHTHTHTHVHMYMHPPTHTYTHTTHTLARCTRIYSVLIFLFCILLISQYSALLRLPSEMGLKNKISKVSCLQLVLGG